MARAFEGEVSKEPSWITVSVIVRGQSGNAMPIAPETQSASDAIRQSQSFFHTNPVSRHVSHPRAAGFQRQFQFPPTLPKKGWRFLGSVEQRRWTRVGS